jgi:hypothetical protein
MHILWQRTAQQWIAEIIKGSEGLFIEAVHHWSLVVGVYRSSLLEQVVIAVAE